MSPPPPDADADGWPDPTDCEDADPLVHPGASEICGNNVDDNCDYLPGDCGLFGDLTIDGDPVWEGPDGGHLGTVLSGGDVPMAVAPGVGVLRLNERLWITGGSAEFGAAVASSGVSLLIGDPGEDAATLWLDAPVVLTGPSGSRAGASVAFMGTDVAIGAPAAHNGDGAVYLLHAPTIAASMEDAVAVLVGDAPGGSAGIALLNPGDANGDGVDDLVVGSLPTSEDMPFLALFLGPIVGTLSLADADARATDCCGPAISLSLVGPCELDGDGAPELLLAAPGSGSNVGYYRVNGLVKTGSWSAGRDINPTVACGDADGDGLDEVAVGGLYPGYVTVATSWWDVATLRFAEDQPIQLAFTTPDTEGYSSLLVGLPDFDGGGFDHGGVWPLAGGPGF